MKKLGFTLSELIVALGVAGVITALSITMLQRVMPDKDKGMVLKAYKVINEINQNILNDQSLYLPNSNVNGTQSVCDAILTCNSKPIDGNHENGYEGNDKYPHLFSDNLNLTAPYKNSGNQYVFTSSDGIKWKFEPVLSVSRNHDGYDITIDVGNPVRNDCTYNSNSCKNPGLFKFNVSLEGKVTAVDNLTKTYLNNPDNLHDRYVDLQNAASQ